LHRIRTQSQPHGHMESGAKEGEGRMDRVVQWDDHDHWFLDKFDC
jgi:hypothetical protein